MEFPQKLVLACMICIIHESCIPVMKNLSMHSLATPSIPTIPYLRIQYGRPLSKQQQPQKGQTAYKYPPSFAPMQVQVPQEYEGVCLFVYHVHTGSRSFEYI